MDYKRFVIVIFAVFLVSMNLLCEEKIVARFDNPSEDILNEFNSTDYDVASYKPGEYLDLVLTVSKYEELLSKGYEIQITQTEEQLRKNLRNGRDLNGYRTYEDCLYELQQIEIDYPDICKLYDIGDSRGKLYSDAGNSNYDDYYHEVWALKVSDNVEVEEDEPCVYYMGEHHAREPISLEVVMAVLYHILDNYGVDPTITENVNNTQIWFAPLVNPNGHKIVTDEMDLWWRKNIRDNNENGQLDPGGYYEYPDGVDPNRNYGFEWGYIGASGNPESQVYHGPYAFSEPEVVAMRELMDAHHFVTGITYHSYGELVLFPFGYNNGVVAPDHDALEELAIDMASTMGYYPQAGWQLYPCMGTTDDYSYGTHGTFSFTIELATEFIPPASQVPIICNENIDAAMLLLDRVNHSTLMGHITDDATGEPVLAEIFIEGVDNTGVFRYPYTSDEDFGTYYRLLTDGSYDVTFSAYGYEPQTIENININNSEVTIVNVAMIPETTTIDVTGTVINGDTGLPIENATVEIPGFGIPSVTTNANGEYIILNLFPYTYEFLVYAENLAVFSGEFTVSEENNVIDFALYEIDDGTFESGVFGNCWEFEGDNYWFIDNTTVYAGTYSAKTGNISDDEYTELSISICVSEDDDISFYRKVSSESGYDYFRFFIDEILQEEWSGNVNWGIETFPVTTGIHTFKWLYVKDGAVSSGQDCAWLDNISFPSTGGVYVGNTQLPENCKFYGNYPNPFNPAVAGAGRSPSTTFCFSLKEDAKVSLNIYNVKGQKIRTLLNEEINPGYHQVEWNGKDNNNKNVSSGVYFSVFDIDDSNGDFTSVKKVILLK